MYYYEKVEPIKSKRNKHGYKGVKRNLDCRQQFIAVRGSRMLGRFDTAYEAGQAYAWEMRSKKEASQQEFNFNKLVDVDATELIKEGFVALLKENQEINFSTREIIDEVFNIKPSQRRKMLKEKNRIVFRNKEYSYGMLDTLFKRWAAQETGIHLNKKVGMNYYFWHESKEDRALKLVCNEYGEFNSTPSSFEDFDDCIKVYYADGDFGFKVSLKENRVVGFKVGLKSFKWEA
jgi:hypothetical protein